MSEPEYYSANINFAKKAVDSVRDESVRARFKDYIKSARNAIKHCNTVQDEATKEEYIVFMDGYTRDLVDNIMSELLYENALGDLLDEYYTLPSRDEVRNKAQEIADAHKQEEERIHKELQDRDAKNRTFYVFQRFAMGQFSSIEEGEKEVMNRESKSQLPR